MPGSMDVLTVLTPRFLGYEQQEENNCPPQPQDNTYKYLTDRWKDPHSHPGTVDPILRSPIFHSPSPMVDIATTSAVPMWISPAATTTVNHPHRSLVTDKIRTLTPPASLVVPSLINTSSIVNAIAEKTFQEGDIPKEIYIRMSRLSFPERNVATTVSSDHDDGEVSVLCDNPDDDDVDVLPHATYDVLATIFDEIYKDDSQVPEEDDDDDDELFLSDPPLDFVYD